MNGSVPSCLASDAPRATSGRRRLVVALALVACSFLASEFAARALFALIGKPFEAGARRRQIEGMIGTFDPLKRVDHTLPDAAALSTDDVVQHPYLGWENFGANKFVAEYGRRYRSQESVECFDVFVFGGSVAGGLSAHANQRLVAALKQDPRFAGRDVLIHNYARAAYKQPQQSMFLCYLLNLGHRPDAVIEIDGFNEVALGWNNAVGNVHPLHPDMTHWGSTARGQRLGWPLVEKLYAAKTTQEAVDEFGAWALSTGLWRSCVLGTVAIHRMSALSERAIPPTRRCRCRWRARARIPCCADRPSPPARSRGSA